MTLPRTIAASNAAIERIRSYETEEQAIADFDALVPYLTAEALEATARRPEVEDAA